jgi:hypothetical protein
MNENPSPSAAETAAQQVEAIISAAEAAAEGIRSDARLEGQDHHRLAAKEADEIRAEARRDAAKELEAARTQAIRLGEDAKKEADTLREQTRRAVEGRVAGAEKAADEVLAEARALSGGLRRLGQSLSEQAERILRDVQAAHKRMRGELRVPIAPRPGPDEPLAGRSRTRMDEPVSRLTSERPSRGTSDRGRPDRDSSREELDVPSWVEP